jgi:hypothetical protein
MNMYSQFSNYSGDRQLDAMRAERDKAVRDLDDMRRKAVEWQDRYGQERALRVKAEQDSGYYTYKQNMCSIKNLQLSEKRLRDELNAAKSESVRRMSALEAQLRVAKKPPRRVAELEARLADTTRGVEWQDKCIRAETELVLLRDKVTVLHEYNAKDRGHFERQWKEGEQIVKTAVAERDAANASLAEQIAQHSVTLAQLRSAWKACKAKLSKAEGDLAAERAKLLDTEAQLLTLRNSLSRLMACQ